ncbi:MAG: YlmC/YmxH family sporulation protein [Clostridia bacterium]
MIRISEIGVKKTVNTADGRILGQISDFEIDPNEGKIRSIVLPVPGKGGLFRRREYISIPWHEIKKIGFDVILVESTGQNIPDFLIDRPF